MAPPISNEQIIRVLSAKAETTYQLFDCKMILTNFTKPTHKNQYFKIFFTSMLCADTYIGADVDYEAFGEPWIDTIFMRINNNVVEFGLYNQDEITLRWFSYRKNKTLPSSGTGCTNQDPDDPPDYDELDRYNDLIEYIMDMF